MAVQPLLIELTKSFVSDLPAGAKVTINGEVKDFPIFRTMKEDGAIKKFVYIDHDVGYIERAALVDEQGRELDVKKLEVEKGEDGFMLVFILEITLKGGVNDGEQ